MNVDQIKGSVCNNNGCIVSSPLTPTPLPTSINNQTASTPDWASWQITHPFGIPTRRSDEIYRMYSPQMTDAFRHGQVSGPWTVSSTARQPHYCHTSYGMPRPQGEVVNNFDAFYTDVFLNDFQNVDTSQYNVGPSLGEWHGNPYFPNYTAVHQHLLIGPPSITRQTMDRRYDSTTLTKSTSWTNPDLHPPLQGPFQGGDLKLQYPGNCVFQERIQLQTVPNPEDVGSDTMVGQQDEVLKPLLSDDVEHIVQPVTGTVEDRAVVSRMKDQQLSVEMDPSLSLELRNGSIKVLQIMDLQHMKREDLEDLKKEFSEHQQMWNIEQDLITSNEDTTNNNNGSAQNGEHGVKETDSQGEYPDSELGSIALSDINMIGNQDSGIPVQKNPDNSENPKINAVDIAPAGHLSKKNNRTNTSLNIARTESPGEQMFSSGPELPEYLNTISLQTDSTFQESNYTVLQERSLNTVTSSEDIYANDIFSLTEATNSRSFGLEATPVCRHTEVTSSDHVTSTTGSKEPKRRSRDIGREVNEPRRPKNGFIRFSIEHRNKIAAQHPKMDNREISRILGCKWRKMTAEAKKRYEDEFEKDIQSIREEHPDWRYAPAKRLPEELIEPMPSRLRPRSSLKRKFPFQARTNTRRQSKTPKKEESPEPGPLLETTWMQCDLCGKWRCVPVCIPKHKLFDVWFCYCNPDPRYNSCSVAEYEDLNTPSSPPSCSLPPSPSSNPSPTSYSTYSNSNAHVLFREPSW